MTDQTMLLPATAMSEPASPPPEPVLILLARKLILLFLLMIVVSLGLVLLLRRVQINSLVMPHLLADLSIGLTAGVTARWILRKQSVLLRVSVLVVFLIGSLELLGWFTGWQIGLGRLNGERSGVDWYSLGQLLLGTGVALLALIAWMQPIPPPVTPAPPTIPVKGGSSKRRQPKDRPRRIPRPKGTSANPTLPPAAPKRKRTAHPKPRLHLLDEEEHRCPYCLELIAPDDPRGTVECSVCHTLHHADCWAITGACQVPHYTA